MTPNYQRLTILGATGSIGASTLNIVRLTPERYPIFALSGHHQVDALAALCHEFSPHYAVVPDEHTALRLKTLLQTLACRTQVLKGAQALIEIATDPSVDCVMAAIVGAAGLAPTYAALKAGKRVLLANKEALVMAGDLMMQAIQEAKATLLPIDSEHNAIFQCLPLRFLAPRLFPALKVDPLLAHAGVEKILLTASGGTFRDLPLAQFASITPEAACQHPNWQMGKKITVDSATMMNKALEVIEAHYLFGLNAGEIDVVIHPQSIIHSLVAYTDGSLLAQLGEPDMRIPIANALAWPERMASGVKPLDLLQAGTLSFKALDPIRYPAFSLGYEALTLGGTAANIINAANERAVAAFLSHKIPFTAIAQLTREALNAIPIQAASDFDTIIGIDLQARAFIDQCIKTF